MYPVQQTTSSFTAHIIHPSQHKCFQGGCWSSFRGSRWFTPPSTLNINQNVGEDATHTHFVDVESIGLRRSTCSYQAPGQMTTMDQQSKEIRPRSSVYMLPILATSVFITPLIPTAQVLPDIIANCYQLRFIKYEDVLDQNLNSTCNSTDPFSQFYVTSKANNKTYSIKKMIQQTRRSS